MYLLLDVISKRQQCEGSERTLGFHRPKIDLQLTMLAAFLYLCITRTIAGSVNMAARLFTYDSCNNLQ